VTDNEARSGRSHRDSYTHHRHELLTPSNCP